METEIISRENIKPSSPTPNHLRTYKLSLLDQIMLPAFYPTVLYFSREQSWKTELSSSQITQILKKSLSLNLTQFYTFSGVIKDSLSIDCNDEGVPFTVTKVKGKLSDFLQKPDLQQIRKYLPGESMFKFANPGTNVLEIQINHFDCGGLAIGMILAHQVADGTTLMTFLKSWAAIARGSHDEALNPIYVARSLFPPKDTLTKESQLFLDLIKFVNPSKYATKRFVFDSLAIATLKAKSASSATPSASRVEVVSAFLWKCFMDAASKGKSDVQKPCLLTHTVNLRRRAKPPLSDKCFGNVVWLTAAQTKKMDMKLKDLVTLVKQCISKLDDGFITSLQRDGYNEKLEHTRKEMPAEAGCLACTSWCNFGLYDLNFGWGKPVWATNFVSPNSEECLFNSVMLMDTRYGTGIEAWMIVEEQYVEALENNEEIWNLTSIDPSLPLEI